MRPMPPYRLAGIVCCTATCLVASWPARADVIDGHWCYADGKRISIEGPAIVTSGGSHIQGDYSRHFLTYVVPPADPDAGQTVSMTLINEDTVQLRIGAAPSYSSDGPAQVWRRCGPPTS
jgi:hypothetical protein